MRVSIVKMPFLEQEYIKFSEKWEYIEDEYLGLEIVESILTQNNCLEKIYNISSAESIIEDIITNNPDVIMLSVMQSSAKNTYDFINSLRSHGYDRKIFIGGWFAKMAWKEILQHQWALDYVCFIDAEDCLENWLKNQNEDIYGIATYQNWKKQHLLRQKARVSPFRYISPSRKAGRGTYAIEMSRGCPHSKCTFCSQSCGNVYKEKWLPLPMDVIRNEIISIYERYGVSRFATSDDDLLGPNKYNLTRALEVRDMVKSLPFPISFSASISVNAACSEQILDILEDAGLEQLCIGFESADEQQLRRYGKAQNLEANFKAAENLSKRNLQILPGLITFDPYSSVESIKKNLSFLFDNLKHFNISKLTKRLHLLTGSPFVKMCRKDNLLTGDYLGYDYVFQDGRIEVIYKILNQYVNLVREVEQSLKSNNLVAASEIRKHHRNAVFHILSGNSIDEYILNEINILKNYRDFQI